MSLPSPGLDVVIAIATIDNIVPGTRLDRVGASTAVDNVVAGAGLNIVIAVPGEDLIVAAKRFDDIGRPSGRQLTRYGLGIGNDIVAAGPGNHRLDRGQPHIIAIAGLVGDPVRDPIRDESGAFGKTREVAGRHADAVHLDNEERVAEIGQMSVDMVQFELGVGQVKSLGTIDISDPGQEQEVSLRRDAGGDGVRVQPHIDRQGAAVEIDVHVRERDADLVRPVRADHPRG